MAETVHWKERTYESELPNKEEKISGSLRRGDERITRVEKYRPYVERDETTITAHELAQVVDASV